MRISDWSSDVCSSDLQGVVQRHVGLHLAVVLEVRLALVEQMDGVADTLRGRVPGVAEVGVGQQGNARLVAKGEGMGGGLMLDVRKFLAVRQFVHRSVGAEERQTQQHYEGKTEN